MSPELSRADVDFEGASLRVSPQDRGVEVRIESRHRAVEITLPNSKDALEGIDFGAQLRRALVLGGDREAMVCVRATAERLGLEVSARETTAGQTHQIELPRIDGFSRFVANARLKWQMFLVEKGFSDWDIYNATTNERWAMPEGIWGGVGIPPRTSVEVMAGALPFDPPIFELHYFDHGRALSQWYYGEKALEQALRELALK